MPCSLRELARSSSSAAACCESGALALHPACWTVRDRASALAPAGQACKTLGGKVEWCLQCAREILGQRELQTWLRHANESLATLRKKGGVRRRCGGSNLCSCLCRLDRMRSA